jgi:hypothetical protein
LKKLSGVTSEILEVQVVGPHVPSYKYGNLTLSTANLWTEMRWDSILLENNTGCISSCSVTYLRGKEISNRSMYFYSGMVLSTKKKERKKERSCSSPHNAGSPLGYHVRSQRIYSVVMAKFGSCND